MVKLLSDQALGESGIARQDGLGFDDYAKVLVDAAKNTPGPFTIGVLGEWGTGKTSIMRLVERRLNSDDDTLVVWFNAWQYEQEEDPIIPLVGTIVLALESEQAFLTKLSDTGKALIRALRAVIYGLSAKTEIQVPGFAKIEAAFVAKEMIDREKHLTSDPIIDRSLYYQAFKALEKIDLPEAKRVVVLIDDLDRCFPDKAVRLLESIKLVLGQRGFIFILGLAQQMLRSYLDHHYKKSYGLDESRGEAYLHKIIQLPFWIPPNADRMQTLAEKLLNEIESVVAASIRDVVRFVAVHVGDNPRALVRFINTILVDQAILGNQTPDRLQLIAVTRLLEQRWPTFFRAVILDQEAAAYALDLQRNARPFEGDPSALTDFRGALNDQALREFVATEACQNWLKNAVQRRQVVQLMRSSAAKPQTATKGKFERSRLVATIVDGNDQTAVERVFWALSKLQPANHVTYTRGQQPSVIDKAYSIVHAVIGDPAGQLTIAAQYHVKAPALNDDDGAREWAIRYLELLFGT